MAKQFFIRCSLITVFLFSYSLSFAQDKSFFMDQWKAEDESQNLQVIERADTVELIVPGGLTLWYRKRLTGNYEICYHVCMVMKEGIHDRLSDLNCFWAANDPENPADLFARSKWRNGIFRNYNTLDLFYVGYGGNSNSTTRFRRYHGKFYGREDDKIKPLLAEYTDTAHLLVPNQWYSIRIRVEDEVTTYSVDGENLFRYSITPGEGDGHFGLRLLQNHVLFTAFTVNALGK